MIPIYEYGQVPNSEIFARDNIASNVEGAVTEILAQVAARGDEALREYTLRFDKADLTDLEVTEAEIDEAFAAVEPEFVEILRQAAANIRTFHEKQRRNSFVVADQPGVVLGQKIVPIQKVGLYVPGGTAAYPSTVLMDSIPAKIAGCPQLVMVTPPGADGKVNPVILAAAKIAGVDRIFKVGGAQAVAGLAFGTETLPKVDKIVGPGNAYVAEAKKQVFGRVAIDMIAGPSEILVVADGTCNAKVVAADMLSQAEHDKMASAVLVTDSGELAKAVQAELERQIPLLPRSEIARASIDNNGKIIVAENLDAAIDIANEIAPEHLELCVDAPFDYLDRVRCAGSIFLGKNCPEALGDYFAGPNHTLPTSGTAKFSSALSVDDFVVKSQFTYYTADALAKIGEQVAYFARKEGLDAHANSITVRLEEKKQ
ncbi:histidinol dehydrogenase [Allofournierella massiliensis]|uniref:Histidinol dehydrogenase n=1 Tax=Allofournierella massiliensis TaxID=1650663 RepID=A0ABT7URD6_9FIRM|nr:histidinol dehydrogenase [Fournierella massiliensis]MDM8201448.1 histidinol dehydrogenase [Fournierella massiliensis]